MKIPPDLIQNELAQMTRVGYSIDLNWLRFFIASGDKFGTNSVDPDQARKSVELIWIQTI